MAQRRGNGTRRIARMLANLVYRDIDVHLPTGSVPDGPVLAVANHFGGLADGVLLVDSLPRMPRVVARDVIWRIPVVGRLADALGGIPVHRAADGGAASNDDMFRSCYDALRADDLVLIFPEGVTQDVPHMAQVRTGAARIALGARGDGVRGIRVLPIGLHYENKAGFRSRVLVDVGEAIDLDAWVGTRAVAGADDREAVRDLTALVDQRLRRVAPDFPDWPTAEALATAAEVVLHDVEPGPALVQYGDQELLAARLNRLAEPTRGVLVDSARQYRDRLAELRSSDAAIERSVRGRGPDRRPSGPGRWWLDVFLVVLLAPYAVLGVLAAAIPLTAVLLLTRLPIAPAVRATLVPGVALLAFTAEAAVAVGRVVTNLGWAAASVGLMMFVFLVAAVFVVHERLTLLSRRWRSRKHPGSIDLPGVQQQRRQLADLVWGAL